MSVLINMDMPKSCAYCDVACRYYLDHRLDGILAKICHTESRLPDCPLVPVPPHGRLIDADALNYTMLYKENWMHGTGVEAPAVWRKDIDAAPTIIEADESDMDSFIRIFEEDDEEDGMDSFIRILKD